MPMRRPSELTCAGCGLKFHPGSRGPVAAWCSTNCRRRTRRRRTAEALQAKALADRRARIAATGPLFVWPSES